MKRSDFKKLARAASAIKHDAAILRGMLPPSAAAHPALADLKQNAAIITQLTVKEAFGQIIELSEKMAKSATDLLDAQEVAA